MRNKDEIFITAEIGINHNGSIDIAKKLIDVAKHAGCNAVKFQKRNIDKVYTQEFLNSPRESPWGKTQRAQKLGLEFGKKEYDEIDKYCKEVSIDWFASAWDKDSVKFLEQYDLKYNKIASAILTNEDILYEIAKQKKHTFISTGLSTLNDIDRAVDIFTENKCPYTIMHCVGIYPCPPEKLNLRMIKTLKDRYNCEIGYSSHSQGVLDTSLAVALGATSLEVHITLDRAMYGSDQAASLEPHGLNITVKNAHLINKMLGSGKKIISKEELAIADKLRYW